MRPLRIALLVTVLSGLCAAFPLPLLAEEAPAVEEEEGPRSAALVLDDGGIRSKVTNLRIFREQLGFFNLTEVPIRAFTFQVGKAEVSVALDRLKSLGREKDRVKVEDFFGDAFEAISQKDVRFTLHGTYEFAEFRIDLSDVRVLDMDPPKVEVFHCASCKRYFASPRWTFCPFDGNKLTLHGRARVGGRVPVGPGESEARPWSSWKKPRESGIRAVVEDDRGKKIEMDDVQLFREKIGFLSIAQEPTDRFLLKMGKGSIRVPFHRIKNIVIERKTASVTDFDDKTFQADVTEETRFFLRGRYHFADAEVNLADVHSVTFLPPSTNLRHCETCGRLYCQDAWTHCPYDGTPLREP